MHLIFIICRRFSSSKKLPKLTKIPSRYRSQAISEAQKALTDYLHTTRSLPFIDAEHISKYSLFSLSCIIRKVQYSPLNFAKSFQRFLRYHPINEFEFFYESIGIDPSEINDHLPAKKFFLSEDLSTLNAATALSGLGFPWNRLGRLYKEDASIFNKRAQDLTAKLSRVRAYGFNNTVAVGICLAFPHVLVGNDDALFDDLRMVLIDFKLMSFLDDNVHNCYDICKKIRVFYDLGCKKGEVGELISRNKDIFIHYSEEVLVQKTQFFCKLNVDNEDVGLLILQYPEILGFDLEKPVISVLGFLKHFGMCTEELKSVVNRYPYVIGRNKFANLPHVMRALNLHEWFFDRIRNGNHHLLGTYVIDIDEAVDKYYSESLEKIQAGRTATHTASKLKLLHEIGFGENMCSLKVLTGWHGKCTLLKERINCLLQFGIEYSQLCKMISQSPKIVNQNPKALEQKMNFLCNEMGFSLQYLEVFPTYLLFDLENRIKPRYRFHVWLSEKGLCTINYSPASIIATSEKQFMDRVFGFHPAALKWWLECFLCKYHSNAQ